MAIVIEELELAEADSRHGVKHVNQASMPSPSYEPPEELSVMLPAFRVSNAFSPIRFLVRRLAAYEKLIE